MAAVEQPSPGFYGAVLHILSNTDSRSRSISVTMSDLTEHLTAEQAVCLPQVIAEVLPHLRTDPERLRFAAHLVARFDFFEAAGGLAEIALSVDDRDLRLAAAMLCGHPSVDATVRRRVADAVGDDRAGRIRLDRSVVPETEDEKRLFWQRWPGARTEPSPFAQAPVVVLDGGFPADAVLNFAIRADRVGASVRRLPTDAEIPFWFGAQTVLVCEPPTRSRVLSSYPGFPERQILVERMPTEDWEIDRLLQKINAALSGSEWLRLADLGPEVEHVLWAPDVFTAGVYPTKDAAFLSGTTASSLNNLRKQGVLQPRESGILLWTFRDVVAVRTWMFLRSRSPRRISSRVVGALAQFAGDSQAVQLGATSEGRVLVNRGDGWDDVDDGQRVMGLSITDIDTVFRPFRYGSGTTIDLLQASANTKLHPTVLNGTPHLRGRRISAKALASVDERCRREAIEAAYPELEGMAFEDTVAIGRQLLSAA